MRTARVCLVAVAAIVREDASVERIYFIERGVVLMRNSACGETPVARLSRGQLVGDVAVLQHQTSQATAVVEEETTAWALSRHQIA